MAAKERVLLSWSGGKDSAMALHDLRQQGQYEVVELLTTVSDRNDRVSHHGVRVGLLQRQAQAIGLPLQIVRLPSDENASCDGQAYADLMRRTMLEYKQAGILAVAFGDLFLEELRAYRERNLQSAGMRALFPIWGRDTHDRIRHFLALGFKAYLSCVDEKLGVEFAGRALDHRCVQAFPADVDPCGEFGEYHSFVVDGPIFREAVPAQVGAVVRRGSQWFADLLPVDDILLCIS